MRLPHPATLRELADAIPGAEILGEPEHRVLELLDDSRLATRESLFIAPPGDDPQAWRFISDAQRRGARAIVVDRAARLNLPRPAAFCLIVPDVRAATARWADIACGEPARGLPIIGVTGTNGKTSVTWMLDAIFRAAGRRSGKIGTLGAHYDDVVEKVGYTTPPPLVLAPLLSRMRARGVDIVAMEVSSHSLALGRTGEMRFALGILTNITHDHLDFHGSFEAYAAAKRRLFEISERRVFCYDDPHGRAFFHEFGGTAYSLREDGIDAAPRPAGARIIRARDVRLGVAQTEFSVDGHPYFLQIPGAFTVANALAAIAAARAFGVDEPTIARALGELAGIPGRMERVPARAIGVFVDYAHTPDALERVLAAARSGNPSRVSVVFGCGGGRDRAKRPAMGEIAERDADRVILTADNPREEDPEAIVAEIRAGMRTTPVIELDRAAAIARAIAEAEPGEAIVIAGKGAETEQIARGARTPFDDREHARAAIAAREAA